MNWIAGTALVLGLATVPALSQDIGADSFDCLMNAAATVKLGAEVPGVLRSVSVERGDRVSVGQPVAQIASEVEEALAILARIKAENESAIESDRVKLDLARKKLVRQEQLRKADVGMGKEYDDAEAEVQVAELELKDSLSNLALARAELARAQAQVNQRRILSPIDGIVTERLLSPGEYVTDQSTIMSLARTDILHVEVYLPVAFVGQVALGDTATIMPDAPVGGEYPAEVTIVDQVVDSSSGTFGVRLKLPNPDGRLPAGLRCKVRFHRPGQE